MTAAVRYHSGNRQLQDEFDSRALADRLADRSRSEFTADDAAFVDLKSRTKCEHLFADNGRPTNQKPRGREGFRPRGDRGLSATACAIDGLEGLVPDPMEPPSTDTQFVAADSGDGRSERGSFNDQGNARWSTPLQAFSTLSVPAGRVLSTSASLSLPNSQPPQSAGRNSTIWRS